MKQKPKRARDVRIRKLLRWGTTKATTRFGIGGAEKTVNKPRPITLPTLNLPETKP